MRHIFYHVTAIPALFLYAFYDPFLLSSLQPDFPDFVIIVVALSQGDGKQVP